MCVCVYMCVGECLCICMCIGECVCVCVCIGECVCVGKAYFSELDFETALTHSDLLSRHTLAKNTIGRQAVESVSHFQKAHTLAHNTH